MGVLPLLRPPPHPGGVGGTKKEIGSAV